MTTASPTCLKQLAEEEVRLSMSNSFPNKRRRMRGERHGPTKTALDYAGALGRGRVAAAHLVNLGLAAPWRPTIRKYTSEVGRYFAGIHEREVEPRSD